MLCVIPHICKDEKYHSDSDHSKQVKNVIKTLFFGESEDKMSVTQDILCTEYTDFDNNIGSFVASKIFTSLHQGSWFCCMYSRIKGY